MKKTKFIPILLTAAMLSGCGFVNIKIEAPLFEKQGKEITQEEFSTSIKEVANNYELANISTTPLGSKVLKVKTSGKKSETYTKNGETVITTTVTKFSDSVTQYDKTNLIAKNERIQKTQAVSKQKSGKTTSNSVMRDTRFLFEGEGENIGKMLLLEKENKKYYVTSTLKENETANSYLDTNLVTYFANALTNTGIAYYAVIEDTTNMRFFQNKSVFTVTFEEKKSATQKEIINDEEVDVSIIETTKTIKAQVKFEDGLEFAKLSSNNQTVTQYLQDWGSYKAGTIIDIEEISYLDCSLVDAKANLKKIDNLKDYHFVTI